MPFELFPIWRDLWCLEPGLEELVKQAEMKVAARFGPRLPPVPEPVPSPPLSVERAIRAAVCWSANKPPSNDPAGMARLVHAALAPELQRGKWARWIELERCLLDASETGDVLFAASVLRTMIEEIGRLSLIDLDAPTLANLAVGNEQQRARLRRYMGAAFVSLSNVTDETWMSHPAVKKTEKRIELTASCKAAVRELNGFVHPNYGSHIAVLYPEGREAASVLTKAIIAVYDQFYALPDAPTAPAPPPASSALAGSRETLVEAFIDERLTPVAASIPKPGIDTGAVKTDLLYVPSFSYVDLGSAARILDDMPKTVGGSAGDFRCWLGANLNNVIEIARARQAEVSASNTFIDEGSDLDRNLQRGIAALEMAAWATQAKLSSLKMQLVRQIVADQPLGVWLVSRALIEQWAFILWLPRTIAAALSEAGTSDTKQGVVEAVAKIIEALSQYLSTQAGSVRLEQRPWAVNSEGKALGTACLPDITKDSFREDTFWDTMYSNGSNVMHGCSAQARPLSVDRQGHIDTACKEGVLILARLSEEAGEILHLTQQLRRLQHAASPLECLADDNAARWNYGIGHSILRRGIDLTGKGTRADPYELAAHVDFYQAAHILAKELFETSRYSLEDGALMRTLDVLENGTWTEHWIFNEQEFWVKMPPFD